MRRAFADGNCSTIDYYYFLMLAYHLRQYPSISLKRPSETILNGTILAIPYIRQNKTQMTYVKTMTQSHKTGISEANPAKPRLARECGGQKFSIPADIKLENKNSRKACSNHSKNLTLVAFS